MDPLLKQLSDETLRSLVSEQRPAWAVPLGQGRPEFRAPVEAEGPPLPQELGAYRGRAAAAYERGQDPASRKAPFYRQIVDAMLALGDQRARDKLMKPYDVGEGFFNPVGAAGVLVGERAAKTLGSITEGKFLAGRQALERGEAPQAVWRQWGVAKTPEGKYVFEAPLKEGESDAIRQFTELYPDVSLQVLRRAGSREGYYDPKRGHLFAQGRVDVPPTDFLSRRRVLEHELQHAADKAEGLSSGTNLKDPNYWNTVGEVRARAVEERLDPRERQWEPSFHEDVDRVKQVIKQDPRAVMDAVKEKGGMWHPEAVERLGRPLYEALSNSGGSPGVWQNYVKMEGSRPEIVQAKWSDRAIRNYLNKYAGTKEDPLKDVEIPFGDHTKRWEDVTDYIIRGRSAEYLRKRADSDYEAAVLGEAAGQSVHYPDKLPEIIRKAPSDERIWNIDTQQGTYNASQRELINYLSHVGDYLRQNVADPGIRAASWIEHRASAKIKSRIEAELGMPIKKAADATLDGPRNPEAYRRLEELVKATPEYIAFRNPLQQYDLVRAVKETAANDARVAKEMEKAAAASMKDLPVHKEYPDGMRWVELRKPEKLTEDQVKSVRPATRKEMGDNLDSHDYPPPEGQPMEGYVALGHDGKPIKNSYTEGLAIAPTREEAFLAGRLAEEGNQMGHCVGGYCEGVASGESRIYSLRDAKGRSHVTIETGPRGMPRSPEHFRPAGAPLEDIVQIKGKQNRAPNAEYLPYVQDFVKGGKWGEVGDLGNTGLVNKSDVFVQGAIPWPEGMTYEQSNKILRAQGGADAIFEKAYKDLPQYATKEQFDDALRAYMSKITGKGVSRAD